MRTPRQQKRLVMDLVLELLQELGIQWQEMRSTTRGKKVQEAREKISVIMYEMLIPYMDEIDMARSIGMSRSTFYAARKRWMKEHSR